MKIGILGGGQLGRMMALAGIPLGLQFKFWEPAPDAPASDVGEVITADFSDRTALEKFVTGLDCISYEFENIPVALVNELSERCPVFPSAKSLEVSQDRLTEKRTFQQLGMGCAPFQAVDNTETVVSGVEFPAILKTRRLGYDGKGQISLSSADELGDAWIKLGSVPALLEQRISFTGEVSLICVRGRNGDIRFYPLVENYHLNGILAWSRVPSPIVNKELQQQAEIWGARLLEALNHIGVLTIEFFLTPEGLLVNEIAPRVHNSGHWTIEGARTSQFENHVRAVSGAPLGSTALRGHSLMLNLVGDNPVPAQIQQFEGAHLHLYRKASRARRKIGHITLNHESQTVITEIEQKLSPLLKPFLKF